MNCFIHLIVLAATTALQAVDVAWLSQPQDWQPLLERWQRAHPDLVTLHAWPQRGGAVVRGLTITRGPADAKKFRLLVAVPHAHEPAPTAAIVEFASRLLDGHGAERERILSQALITLLPDTNSQGRQRAPERCWDGKLDNEEFLKWAFGIAADGQRFGRYPEWRPSEYKPQRIGLVYEQVEDDLWVESNTSRRSTHTRATDELFARYRYTHHLDMHQHEYDEAALLPSTYDEMPAEARAQLDAWAAALIQAWRDAGAQPRPQATIPYRGQPRQQFFKEYWAGRCPGMLKLTCEVRNNRHAKTGEPTPQAHQFRMSLVALTTTVQFGLKRNK